ncbi:MAG: hypothetical protein EP338_06045 [Bacteroidetes bacterium]|nr:MAG: hypothetical protein EP338_06045 [Bacteroidota bacterium]
MSLLQFIRLILNHLKWLILPPLGTALILYWVLKDQANMFKSNTTIYTGLASGYTIENGSEQKTDYNLINSAFDNIINIIGSRETRLELALRLLAKDLVAFRKASGSSDRLNEQLIDQFRISDPEISDWPLNSEEDTYLRLQEHLSTVPKSSIHNILFSEQEEFYSVHQLENIVVQRIGNSDLIRLEYQSTNPRITKNTLDLMTAIFIKNYKKLKSGETNNVSEFFEQQTKLALQKLNEAEEGLKKFRTENRIINYNEQTKFISEKNEEIQTSYYDERMKLVSAIASKKKSEAQLGSYHKVLENNRNIVKLRTELSALNIQSIHQENPGNEMRRQEIVEQIEKEAQASVKPENMREGIQISNLAMLWIDHTIAVDASRARLALFEERISEIEADYDTYAPLGSNIHKMEREIEVLEKEYLSHLASLNASKLREKNLQISSNLQVIDPAFLPREAEPNKKTLLLISGTLSCFTLILIFLVSKQLLDQSIKNVQQACALTGLTAISAYPRIFTSFPGMFENRVLKLLSHKVWNQIDLLHQDSSQRIVSIISSQKGSGKSFVLRQLHSFPLSTKWKIAILAPQSTLDRGEDTQHIKWLSYQYDYDLLQQGDLEALCGEKLDSFSLILIELPSLAKHIPSSSFLERTLLNVFVLRGDRIWGKSDKHLLECFQSVHDGNTKLFLNCMSSDELEEFAGELPKRRAYIRKLIKRWLRFNFSYHSSTPRRK